MKTLIIRMLTIICSLGLLLFYGCQPGSVNPSSGLSSQAVTTSQTDSINTSTDLNSTGESKIDQSSTAASNKTSSSSKSSNKSSANYSSKAPSTSSKDEDDYSLPTNKTPWKQKNFYLSTFRAVERDKTADVYEKSLAAHKEAGINLVENAILATTDMFRALDACEKIGIDCLAQDISSFSGMGDKYPLNNEDMLIDTVMQLNKYKRMIGYFIWDEPSEKNFKKLQYVNSFFKDIDPARLSYSLVLPSYGTYSWSPNHANWQNDTYKKYIDGYLSTSNPDVVCVDYYPFRGPVASISENYLWRDLGYLRKKALELNKPLWFYFQAVNMDNPAIDLGIEKMKVQMYSALAYGTVGLSYYMSLGVIVDADGNKLPRFNQIKALNGEVLNLGKFLFNKKSSKLYHTGVSFDKLVGYFTDNLAQSDLIQQAPQDVLMGVFTDNSSAKYLVVVNKNFNNALNGSITLKSAKNISQYNKKTNTTAQISASASSINCQIPAGDCAVYILK